MSVEFPGNTNLFSYTDRRTDRQTDVGTCRQVQTDRRLDRQVNKFKGYFICYSIVFFLFRGGGGWLDKEKTLEKCI